jgi:hypothetical protein
MNISSAVLRAYATGRMDAHTPDIVTDCRKDPEDIVDWWNTQPGHEVDATLIGVFELWLVHLEGEKRRAWRKNYEGYILNAFEPDSRTGWSELISVSNLHDAASDHADDMWRDSL